jgi:putative membrane protein
MIRELDISPKGLGSSQSEETSMATGIRESLSGLGAFGGYFALSLVYMAIFAFIYGKVTPYSEIELIKQGKSAPAISYGGAILGFIIPLASVVAHSVNSLDMAIWSSIALVVQILVFVFLRLLFRNLVRDISEDKVGPAIFLALLSVSVGILNAASMVY